MHNKATKKDEQPDLEITKSKLCIETRDGGSRREGKDKDIVTIIKQIEEPKLFDSEVEVTESKVIETTSSTINLQQKLLSLNNMYFLIFLLND